MSYLDDHLKDREHPQFQELTATIYRAAAKFAEHFIDCPDCFPNAVKEGEFLGYCEEAKQIWRPGVGARSTLQRIRAERS